jgi:Ca2+-transporting ATPase
MSLGEVGSCETMANASVICTDNTGTLTQNSMFVVVGSVGIHAKFIHSLDLSAALTNAEETELSTSGSEIARKYPLDFSIDQSQLNTVLSGQIQELFNEAIAINSTAFEDTDPAYGDRIFVGSKLRPRFFNSQRIFNGLTSHLLDAMLKSFKCSLFPANTSRWGL